MGRITDDAVYSIITAGTTIVADATGDPVAIVDESTPCKRVWIAAPVSDTGASVNTKVVRVGDGTADAGYPVLPDDYKGYYIPISDAADLLLIAAEDGDGVTYVVLG